MGAIFSKFGESCEDNWHQVMNEMANSRSGFDAWISKRKYQSIKNNEKASVLSFEKNKFYPYIWQLSIGHRVNG